MLTPIVLIPLGAAFVALALWSACVVGTAAAIAARWPPSTGRPSPALRAAIVFAPAAFAVLGCAALAFPDPFMGCHCAVHELHHPHFCASHPHFALPLVMPAAFLLGIWIALAAPRLYRLARDGVVSARWVKAVRRLPLVRLDGVGLRLADCAARGAFTIGMLSPIIVFDRVLWRSLSEEERRTVIQHEQGHVERRDGLTLFALRFCLALFPIPGGRRLLNAWRAAAEHACDRYAVAKLGDSAAVAGALIAVEKVRAREHVPAIPTAALGALDAGDLEQRVLALLDSNGQRDVAPLLANDTLASAIVTLGALLLTVAWPGGVFHHAIETLLGHLVH